MVTPLIVVLEEMIASPLEITISSFAVELPLGLLGLQLPLLNVYDMGG